MKNKRYNTNERIICNGFCRIDDRPTTKKLSQITRKSRSACYGHHHSVYELPNDNKKYLLSIYKDEIGKYLSKEETSLKTVFLHTLSFISKNQELFKVYFKTGQKDIFKEMFDQLRPKIAKNWHIEDRKLNQMYEIYKNEVLGIIESWHERSFSDHAIGDTLNDIVYLTKTAPHRLTKFICDSSTKSK